MIRLTRANGTALYINDQYLINVEFDEDYNRTLVSTSTIVEGWHVLESPEEVARKVLEWRLAMERYKALAKALASATENLNAYNNELDEQEKILLVLAGLEEPNHD